jgi:integrase
VREQVDKIIGKMRPDAREAVTVAAATGLRRGELFGLEWADVDFGRNLIHVHRSNYAGHVEDGDLKTDAAERTIPLFKSVRKLLLERKARERYSEPHHFVFGSTVGTAVDPGNFVKREFRPAVKSAGYEGRFRWHDLRHFAVSQLIAQRADILLLAAVAGHSKPSVTLDVYGHLMTERVTEAANLYDPLGEAAASGR